MTPLLLAVLILVAVGLGGATAYGGLKNRLDPSIGAVGATAALLCFGVAAYGSLSVQVGIDANDAPITDSYVGLALLCLAGALVMLVVLASAVITVLDIDRTAGRVVGR